MENSGKVSISFAELQKITGGEAFKRIALKEKGLPMTGNFYPEFRQDYRYRLEYDFKNLCETYHFSKET